MAFLAGRSSITSRIDRRPRALAAFLLLACSPFACLASAQDFGSSPALEELIPDAAVENPEEWAKAPPPAEESNAAPETAVTPESPMSDIPGLTVPWPDEETIPEPEALSPDPDIQFATDQLEPLPPLPEGKRVRVSSDLTLVFPEDAQEFPIRDRFVDRFEQLSTIEELSDGDENVAQLAVRARVDEEMLERLLRIYGYYDGYVIRSVGGIQAGEEQASDTAEVRFDILPGVQYKFGAIDLGALPSAPDYEKLRSDFEIWPGDPVLADKIEEERFDLDRALGETGYPFARIDEPSLLIDHARQEGDLTMPVQPGGKYRFGAVASSMPEFLSSHHLRDIARFEAGDVYQRSLEMDLRRAVLATGLVSSVTITPRETRPPAPGEPGEVALDVEMSKAPLRTIAGAIGYGTGEGVRAEASWEHRNLFPPEGMLRVRGIAGTREQLAGVTFRRNNWHGRDRILTIDAFASSRDRDAYDARTVSLAANFERSSTLLFQKPLTWSVGLEVLATDERERNFDGENPPRETFFIGALPLRAQIDATDSLLDPTHGFRLGGKLSPEISTHGGDNSTYLRAQLDASYYQPFGSGIVIAGRTRVGTIVGTDIGNVAPSRRLYAGGGGSVRGYGYQEIGPRNDDGDANGGRSLVEFSLEARIDTGLMGGALSVAPFIDAGAVNRGSTPSFDNMQYGAGLGFRYKTGFGPLRIDIATPLNPRPGDGPIAVYVALGQSF